MSGKAFELVPAIDKAILSDDLRNEGANLEISCLDCCSRNVFIGTSFGSVIHYILEEKKQGEKFVLRSHIQGKKTVAKKPIEELKFVAAFNKLVVLIDSVIGVLDATKFDLSSNHDKLKNVCTFSVNEDTDKANPFGRKVCLASKKRYVQLYNLTAEKWIHVRDIAVPEPPLHVCMNDSIVCIAIQTRYILLNTENSKTLDLFPYDREEDTPFIKRISTGEFLLGGPSFLGMFVNTVGVSQRPPLQLSSRVQSLAYCSPYIVTLGDQFLRIHNVLDQQQKQPIQFHNGVSLHELGDRIVVATKKEIYALVPVPWQKQVDALLADSKVEEAVTLAEASGRTSGLTRSQFESIFKTIQQKAGFIEMSKQNFDSAQKYFTEGSVDPREVISLFPGLLSTSSDFVRSVPPLHEHADVGQMCRGNLNKMEDCKSFLARFLQSYRGQLSHKKDVHTTLMKVFAENQPRDLIDLLQKVYVGYQSDTIDTLTTFGRQHALALYYEHNRKLDKALDIWCRLLAGDLEDNTFNEFGLPYVAQILSESDDSHLILTYVPAVLSQDATLGAQIFTRIYDSKRVHDKKLQPDGVIEFLSGKFSEALCLYLEHLVKVGNEQKEAYHSHLAMLYIDSLQDFRKLNEVGEGDEKIPLTREKLQSLLQNSDKYSVNLLLGRLECDEWFLPETAILHGKAGNDKLALEILIDKLQDYKSAENYCIRESSIKKSNAERQELFETLLVIYLEKTKSDESMRILVIDLLNNPQATFNAAKVAKMLPDNWSIAILSKFLLNSVRSSLHDKRQYRIAKYLSERENMLAQQEYLELRSVNVHLTEYKSCSICHQVFKDPSFTRLVDGSLVHNSCYRKL